MINVNMTGKAGVTLATAGKYCADNVKVTPSAEILRKDEQAKTATPTETAQDITPDSGKVLSKVSVGAIPKTYVGSGVTKKAAATVAPSTSEQTVCASGVYTTGEQKVSAITPSIVGNLDASSFAASIVSAIEGKGVDVPSGAKLDALAALVESIQAGGGGVINLGDYFTNITVASITPAEDMTIGSGVFAALNISELQGTTFVVANNEYRRSIGNSYVRLAFYPRFVYVGIWRILYGTGTSSSNEEWYNSHNDIGGSTYRLKAGIKYEVVYIEAPY